MADIEKTEIAEVDVLEKGKKKGGFKQKAPWIVTSAAVVGLGVALVILFSPGEDPAVITPPSSGGRGIVAVPGNIDELLAKRGQPVEDGQYRTRMNVKWEFESWNKPSTNAFVENAPENTKTVYFDVFLDSTGELVYSSPFIPVGSMITLFALREYVPKGEHDATVTYHLVDLLDDKGNEYEEVSTLSVGVKLIINS